jgi:hypothetical protein
MRLTKEQCKRLNEADHDLSPYTIIDVAEETIYLSKSDVAMLRSRGIATTGETAWSSWKCCAMIEKRIAENSSAWGCEGSDTYCRYWRLPKGTSGSIQHVTATTRIEAAMRIAGKLPVVVGRDGVPEGVEDTQNGPERTQDEDDDETVERLDHLGEDVDMIKDRLMGYGVRLGELETDMSRFGPCLNKVRDDVAILKDRLNGVFEERLAKVEEALRRMGHA